MSIRRRSWTTSKGEAREAWVVDYADQAGQLFSEARTNNADDALKLGIIHEISDLAIPAGTPILTLVFN